MRLLSSSVLSFLFYFFLYSTKFWKSEFLSSVIRKKRRNLIIFNLKLLIFECWEKYFWKKKDAVYCFFSSAFPHRRDENSNELLSVLIFRFLSFWRQGVEFFFFLSLFSFSFPFKITLNLFSRILHREFFGF